MLHVKLLLLLRRVIDCRLVCGCRWMSAASWKMCAIVVWLTVAGGNLFVVRSVPSDAVLVAALVCNVAKKKTVCD